MASKLLHTKPHEAENPLELSLCQAYQLLEPQLKPPFPLTIPSPSHYSNLNQALLYALLTQPNSTKIHITHLHAIVTDGYTFFTNLLLKLVFESYPKLLETPKIQLLFVTRKLVQVSAVGVDGLLICLLRQILGGDFSDGNLWLCVELLRIFLDDWDWFLEEPFLLTSGLFTYLRLLADHYRLSGVRFDALKRMEIDFCVRILRNHFNLCLRIGRDLLRLLQDLVYIPEFKAIWKDLLLNPSQFRAQGFSDISQLYCSRTSSRYHLLRITPEMERQLRFLLTHVKWGFQIRYQAWFFRKFLCRPEGETAIADIVRFICCAHHPSNEIIQSNVVARWAIIGWLLKCCRTSPVEANTKLALFYDWMFYNEGVDNIMNIEPGILLMVNFIPEYVDMTHSLLEFLFHLVDNYDVQRKDVIARGVSTAFTVLVTKGVVQSLEAFSSCPFLSPSLKERLLNISSKSDHTIHVPHCSLPQPSLPSPTNFEKRMLLSTNLTPKCPKENGNNTISPVLETPATSCSQQMDPNKSPIGIMEDLVRRLGLLGEFINGSYDLGLQILEEILCLFAEYDSRLLDGADIIETILHPETLARRVTEAFKSHGYEMFVPLKSPPKFSGDEEIQSATALIICTFIFCQNRRTRELFLFWSRNDYGVGPRFLSYVSRLAYEADKIGCFITPKGENIFIGISESETPLLKHHIDKYVSYTSARGKNSLDVVHSASSVDSKQIAELIHGAFISYQSILMLSKKVDTSLARLLFSDLMSCCEWEKKSLKELLCNIFRYIPDLSTCKEEFIGLIVEKLDYADLVCLQFEKCLQSFSMLGEDTDIISRVIKISLDWGFVEQQKFWALMASEQAIANIGVEKVVKDFFCLGVLDPNVHSIAIGGLFTLCIRCAPTPELVTTMMSLPDHTFEGFAASVLANWVVSHGSLLFNSLGECLEKIERDSKSVLFTSTGVRLNHSSIFRFLNFLHKQGKEWTDGVNKLSVSVPEIKAKLADAAALPNIR